MKHTERQKIITRTSGVSIAANLVLVAFKAIFGILSNSVAITLDAVNNLGDIISSVITAVGIKLASRKPDKKHPYGHGRIEYISQIIVGALILFAGIMAGYNAVLIIITPNAPDYSPAALIVMAVAIGVKIVLGLYMRKMGGVAESETLKASGVDALSDAVLTLSVLISALIYIFAKVNLEGFVGVLISVFIVKAGFDIIRDAVNEMLGLRISSELSHSIKDLVAEDNEVIGVYDLLMHNYGPGRYMGSVHVEVSDDLTADNIDSMSRRIQEKVFSETGVILAAIGVYAHKTDDHTVEARNKVSAIVSNHPEVLQMHGFYINEETKSIRFDVVLDYAADDKNKLVGDIAGEVKTLFSGYDVRITPDEDVSDI